MVDRGDGRDRVYRTGAVDVCALGLLVLLPALGLLRVTRALLAYVAITLVPVGCAFFAILAAIDPSRSLTHTAVTLFLTLVSLTLAAFVAKARPKFAGD